MRFFTEEQYQKLLDNGSPSNRDKDHPPIVKLFLPGSAATWLLSELDPEETTIAFGLCDLGLGFPELGYVSITELEDLIHPHFRSRVECDIHFEGKHPLTIYAEAARMICMITEDEKLLQQAHTARLRRIYPKKNI